MRKLLSNSPSSALTMVLGYESTMMVHAVSVFFFPGEPATHRTILERSLERLVDPSLDTSAHVFYFTRLLDAGVSMMQLVRCVSTQNPFPRAMLESSHAYSEMCRR